MVVEYTVTATGGVRDAFVVASSRQWSRERKRGSPSMHPIEIENRMAMK